MQRKKVDVVIIGGGPGGYPAAIRLAQKGKKVVLVEAQEVGGTCLNWGCIPTKMFLNSAAILQEAIHGAALGLRISEAKPDWPQIVAKKNEIVKRLRSGVEGLLKSAGVELVRGFGSFSSPKEIVVDGKDACLIEASHVIIATGSEAKELKNLPFDGQRIHSSKTIMDLEQLPTSIAIIGAGAIGAEFATLFSALGTKVTLIEALPRILPLECETVSTAVSQVFRRNGIDILCGTMVTGSEKTAQGVRLTLNTGASIEVTMVLVGVGRALNTDRIGLEKVGVRTEKGSIVVDELMSTNVKGIWAIGDITAKPMLAHVATHQGLVAAANIVGEKMVMRYDAIPSTTFTIPEVGSVGLCLETALQQKIRAKRATFPLQALGKAVAIQQTDGFAQIVFEEETKKILGAQVVGEHASDLIAEMTLAITNELTLECITETIHSHPTMAESWAEASLVGEGFPIHIPRKKS